jgi:hypothetical protein
MSTGKITRINLRDKNSFSLVDDPQVDKTVSCSGCGVISTTQEGPVYFVLGENGSGPRVCINCAKMMIALDNLFRD